jgi:hypothetical protein
MNILNRLEALEAKVENWEARRRKLVPTEFDSDPSTQEYIRKQLYALRVRVSQRIAEEEQANLEKHPQYGMIAELAAKAMTKLSEQEMLKDLMALEHYERTGESLEGYEFVESAP